MACKLYHGKDFVRMVKKMTHKYLLGDFCMLGIWHEKTAQISDIISGWKPDLRALE